MIGAVDMNPNLLLLEKPFCDGVMPMVHRPVQRIVPWKPFCDGEKPFCDGVMSMVHRPVQRIVPLSMQRGECIVDAEGHSKYFRCRGVRQYDNIVVHTLRIVDGEGYSKYCRWRGAIRYNT